MERRLIKVYLGLSLFIFAGVLALAGFLVWQGYHETTYQKDHLLLANQLNIVGQELSEAQVIAESIKMTFFGDLMLDRNVGQIIKQKGLDYIFEKIKDADLFKNKNIISCNLEGAVTNSGAHYPLNNAYDFAFSPEIIGQLKNYGFNFFNLANNHFSDQGQRGIDETRQNLDSLGFNYFGCPDGQIGECSYKIIELRNGEIGLVGFSAVYAKLDQEQMKEVIMDLRNKADFIIVNMHWGNEYQHKFNQYQQELAHALIDSGANLVIGHHPHVVQGLEIYQGKPIFYSLGNFIFDQYFSADTQQGLALDASLNSDKMEILLIPLESSQSQVSLMAETNKDNFLQKLAGWSETGADYFEQIKSGRLILER